MHIALSLFTRIAMAAIVLSLAACGGSPNKVPGTDENQNVVLNVAQGETFTYTSNTGVVPTITFHIEVRDGVPHLISSNNNMTFAPYTEIYGPGTDVYAARYGTGKLFLFHVEPDGSNFKIVAPKGRNMRYGS